MAIRINRESNPYNVFFWTPTIDIITPNDNSDNALQLKEKDLHIGIEARDGQEVELALFQEVSYDLGEIIIHQPWK